MACRRDFGGDNGGCQTAAAMTGPGCGYIFYGGGEGTHVDAENFISHVVSPYVVVVNRYLLPVHDLAAIPEVVSPEGKDFLVKV